MRHLLATAAFLIVSPAFAGTECFSPPGSPRGSAQWSSNGKVTDTYLTTSNGDRYTCGPDVKQNNPTKQAGSKGYYKRVCGPLTIVTEISYRYCTVRERAGISDGYSASSRALGALGQYLCASQSNITSDTRYELRDKNGQVFQLGKEYGMDSGNSDISDSCTREKKTQYYTKTWGVGTTSKTITLTRVTEYQAEAIRQPSL